MNEPGWNLNLSDSKACDYTIMSYLCNNYFNNSYHLLISYYGQSQDLGVVTETLALGTKFKVAPKHSVR